MKRYLGVAMMMALAACSNAAKTGDDVKDSAVKAETSVAAATAQLADPKIENIYNGYISLKNMLVAGKAAGARQSAAELSKYLSAFSGCENTALIADKIAATEDLKLQRREFTSLSSDVIALFKHVDLKKGSIYVQHCPMANNGDGGDWLSSEKKINNPYYGDEMLECGAVVEEIKAKL
jgi:hypothetical protein